MQILEIDLIPYFEQKIFQQAFQQNFNHVTFHTVVKNNY